MQTHRLSLLACLPALSCAQAEFEADLLAALDQQAKSELTEVKTKHLGPPVASGASGPARFVPILLSGFDQAAAKSDVAFIDRYYRAPAGDGYEATVDYLIEALGKAGFGKDPRFELKVIETDLDAATWTSGQRAPAKAWTPLSASMAVVGSDGERSELHSFTKVSERDRTILPIHAPSCDLAASVSFHLEGLEEGQILVVKAPLSRSLIRRAQTKGAVAVISSSFESFNTDPTGAERHLDFVQYRTLYYPPQIPVGQISPRSFEKLKDAFSSDPASQLEFKAEVRYDERKLRTIVATLVGAEKPQECVAVSSHINEPGAGDNASGVAGMLQLARAMASAVESGEMMRPSRSMVFVWGDEFRMTEIWLASSERETIAGISADMLGQSKSRTGAVALVERMPDPGAVRPLEPDVHTPWGANPVDPEELKPNGFATIARCAMVDVGSQVGGWETADHPWEGGSDHDIYIRRGVPGLLFWHFTDFAYHSNLDRMDMLDFEELRRTAVALGATALSVAHPLPTDLDRYLRTNDMERNLRVDAALGDDDPDLAENWRDWCTGARHWLRALCLDQ